MINWINDEINEILMKNEMNINEINDDNEIMIVKMKIIINDINDNDNDSMNNN